MPGKRTGQCCDVNYVFTCLFNSYITHDNVTSATNLLGYSHIDGSVGPSLFTGQVEMQSRCPGRKTEN